jgi:hypothetical protein
MNSHIKIEDAVVYLDEITHINFEGDLEYDDLEYDENDGNSCYNMVVGFKGGGKVVINLGDDEDVARSKYQNYVGVITDAKDELRKEQLLLG